MESTLTTSTDTALQARRGLGIYFAISLLPTVTTQAVIIGLDPGGIANGMVPFPGSLRL